MKPGRPDALVLVRRTTVDEDADDTTVLLRRSRTLDKLEVGKSGIPGRSFVRSLPRSDVDDISSWFFLKTKCNRCDAKGSMSGSTSPRISVGGKIKKKKRQNIEAILISRHTPLYKRWSTRTFVCKAYIHYKESKSDELTCEVCQLCSAKEQRAHLSEQSSHQQPSEGHYTLQHGAEEHRKKLNHSCQGAIMSEEAHTQSHT